MTTTQDVHLDVAQVRERSTQWLAEVASGNVERIVSFYEGGASFLVPNAPLARGSEAVRAMWGALLSAPELTLRWEPLSIDVSSGGDMACEIGSYTLRMRPGDMLVEDEGKYVVVWRKEGGEWFVHADIFNSSRGP